MTDETSTTANDKTSLRSLLAEVPSGLCSHDYHLFCREERNLAALLYHLLLQDGGIERFMDMEAISASMPDDPKQIRVYFEYAHVRDLWAQAGLNTSPDVANDLYRKTIIELLQPPPTLKEHLRIDGRDGVKRFNDFFGASPQASEKSIQMPARWGKWLGSKKWLEKYGAGLAADDLERWLAFAKRATVLKWAFNAKPDIVIHTSPITAICIEAKLESKEALYSAVLFDGEPFAMEQTEVQRFILEQLLGYETQFVFLSGDRPVPGDGSKRTKRRETPHWQGVFGVEQATAVKRTNYNWTDLFSALADPKEPTLIPFASEWLNENRYVTRMAP